MVTNWRSDVAGGLRGLVVNGLGQHYLEEQFARLAERREYTDASSNVCTSLQDTIVPRNVNMLHITSQLAVTRS